MAPDAQAEQKLRALKGVTQVIRPRLGQVRHRGLATHAWSGPATLDGRSGRWRRLGADMVMLYPMYRITNVDDHIETLRRFNEVARG